MDSSVTPTSPSEMIILVAGLLIMLCGVYKVYRERGRPGLLILWGGLVDLGLAIKGPKHRMDPWHRKHVSVSGLD